MSDAQTWKVCPSCGEEYRGPEVLCCCCGDYHNLEEEER